MKQLTYAVIMMIAAAGCAAQIGESGVTSSEQDCGENDENCYFSPEFDPVYEYTPSPEALACLDALIPCRHDNACVSSFARCVAELPRPEGLPESHCEDADGPHGQCESEQQCDEQLAICRHAYLFTLIPQSAEDIAEAELGRECFDANTACLHAGNGEGACDTELRSCLQEDKS